MTHSIDTPFPPPPTAATGSPSGSDSSAASTANAAKDQAKNVGQTAAQAGGEVASTAADQAKQVAHETQRQAQDLLEQGRSQLREQATTQQHRAAEGLSAVAQELRGMLGGNGESTSGPAHDMLHQATGRVEELADWLKNREPADLLGEVRSFARRKPGTFLLGAALAGVVAGRLTRGVRAAHSDSSGGAHADRRRSPGTEYSQTNYVDPSPAYSGLSEPSYGPDAGIGSAAGGTPVPPPPYGTVPPAGSVVPPTTPAGWDDPARRPGTVS